MADTYQNAFNSDPTPGNILTRPDWPITSQVAVTATITKVATARGGRGSVTIRNLDIANNVYVGNEGVTSATGFPLEANEAITIGNDRAVFAICSGGQAAVVGVIEDVG